MVTLPIFDAVFEVFHGLKILGTSLRLIDLVRNPFSRRRSGPELLVMRVFRLRGFDE